MTQIRPKPADYAPFYEKYIALVPEGDLLVTLASQGTAWRSMLGGLTAQQSEFRYEPAKWSIKEVVGHVTDTERIFSYRALRIARGDQTSLSGFEQDDYIKEGNYAARTLADLAEELSTVRASTLSLLRSLSPDAWTRRGNANQKEVTVCALGFITAGHAEHHRLILEQRYPRCRARNSLSRFASFIACSALWRSCTDPSKRLRRNPPQSLFGLRSRSALSHPAPHVLHSATIICSTGHCLSGLLIQ